MAKGIKLRITESILRAVYDAFQDATSADYKFIRKKQKCSSDYFSTAVYRLQKRGVLRLVKNNGETFFELTRQGELEALLIKADIKKQETWDKKWRLIIFDIPEDDRNKRDELRKLLKQHGFFKLQASVFINPYPLNRQAIDFLKEKNLLNYIRILRVDDIDYDLDLKKHFKL